MQFSYCRHKEGKMADQMIPDEDGPIGQTDAGRLATGRLIDPGSELDEVDVDIRDLASRLRFSLDKGRIWLDTNRVALIHLSTLSSLRREMIDKLGMEEARGFFARMGYSAGSRDANLARKLKPHHPTREAYSVGPQLRKLQGVTALEPVKLEIDVSSGHFYAEANFQESYEADSHIASYGMSDGPVCWMQIGYASGYASTFMGRSIIYREMECRAAGAKQCRMVGKPVEEWDDIEMELRALQPEAFANRFTGRTKSIVSFDKGGAADMFAKDLVGASPGFVATCHLIKKVADTNATVLFLGETGVGKEVFARTLHNISPRGDQPFIAINCAAIPENLVEAELFGVERGAFTGAVSSRPGRFERAHGGTLFLDEIGSLNSQTQIKLLRALQEREVERVGGTEVLKVDVRIVTATNESLDDAVKEGRFREDLLFRLNVFPVNIPPLRDRRDDIPLLMGHFLHRYTEIYQRQVPGFTSKAVDALYEYDYPGNIRELENLIERAVILTDEKQPIDVSHLFADARKIPNLMMKLDEAGSLLQQKENASLGDGDGDGDGGLLDRFLKEGHPLEKMEAQLLREAVEKSDNNLSRAARLLGLTRPQMAYRLKKLER